jgi:hypothetical protein
MRFSAAGLSISVPPELAGMGMDPLEQGGLLLGHLVTSQSVRVVTFTRPGPLDIRTPGMFVLQDPQHERELNESGLRYLGFWHSHPCGTPSEYSPEDLDDWQNATVEMFAQLPPEQTLIFYPIVTGDRLRVWAMGRDLTLTELQPEEVMPCSIPTIQLWSN